ncbi:coiled-coil domain-containing protein 150-like [Stylophora pistillata]|uniref:coiled-coil domain-containing protein 150-like n=1 Tax=Stylophora pistillata TaxID=50429 RepID=UPI000C03EDDB|nr:coiled-coil domain-containing protein 150-like [Stylophora pistillata]
MSVEKISRKVISPTMRSGSNSSPQHTFEVMQRRLQMAEEETKKLVDQLADYGFSRDRADNAENGKSGRIDPVHPFKASGSISPEIEILQRNYEQMVSRVCRAESTIQSLKLAMCSLEAEKNLAMIDKEPDMAPLPKDTYENEIKKLRKDLHRYKKELETCEAGKKESQTMVKRLASELDTSTQINEQNRLKVEEFQLNKQKSTKKINELTEELKREKDLRSSLEESHLSLLQRVSDMEKIVESGRGDVQTLAQDCQTLRREAVSAREELEKVQRTKGQLEALVTQLQEGTVNSDSQLATLTAERKTLNADVTKFRTENKELRQQFEVLRKSYEDLKVFVRLLSALREEISTLHKQLLDERGKTERLKQEFDREVFTLQTKIEELTREREHLTKENDVVRNEVNQAVSDFSNERDKVVGKLKDAEGEIQGLEESKKLLEEENQKLLERICALEEKQVSQGQIEEAMKGMMESKNRLAFEKGSLQSRVEHLQQELKSFGAIKAEAEQLRKINSNLQTQQSKNLVDVQSCKSTIKKLESQIREGQSASSRKDSDLRSVIQSREDALREVEKLVQHAESLERKHSDKVDSLQRSLSDARENSGRLSSTIESLMKSHAELQEAMERLQTEMGQKDSELNILRRDKISSQELIKQLQYENDALQSKMISIEQTELQELRPLREALSDAQVDREGMSVQLERLLSANKELQDNIEVLQTELGRKQVEFEKLLEARDHQIRVSCEEKATEVEQRVEEVLRRGQKDLQETRAKHKKEISKLKKDLEDANSYKNKFKESNKKLEDKVKELEEQLSKNKSKLKSQKVQLEQLRKSHKAKDMEEETAKSKTEHFKKELNNLERVKNEYMRKNSEQAKTIGEFVSKFADLQTELETLIQAQRDKEEELEQEKSRRKELEQRYKKLQAREKDLETSRKETEKKLAEANFETKQVSENLREAQEWFKEKFGSLQAELTRSRKVQEALEKRNKENFKKRDEEKRKVDEATEKAKELMRASRMTISKLASDVAENHWETKGMKHALQAERDYNLMTTEKLERLKESTSRQMEGLAMELDTLRRSTRR